MKPRFFIIIALVAAWGMLGVSYAQAQPPLPPPMLNVQLSKALSRVVDPRGVEVHLWCDFDLKPFSTLGNSTNREAWISLVHCNQADLLAAGRRPSASAKGDFAVALGYLLRAANTAVGLDSLGIAECKAAQQVESFARELGAGPVYARDLANTYWIWVGGGTESCRPGGPMDFHLGNWPTAAYAADLGKG